MIRWFPERKVPLAKMLLPGDIRRRATMPHVEELSRSVELGVCPRLPTLRKERGKLTPVGGIDVLAAHVRLQRPEVLCRVFEATDNEAGVVRLSLELEEGEHTEENRRALAAKVSALKEEILANPEVAIQKGGGRRRSALGLAIKEASKLTGVDERKIRRIYREHAADEAGWGDEPTQSIDDAQIKTWGMRSSLSDEWLTQVARIQYWTIKASDHAAKAAAAVARMRTESLPIPDPWLKALSEPVEQAKRATANFLPVCLCVYCKGVAGVQESCVACVGLGWNTRKQAESAPARLHDEIDRVVVRNGEAVRLTELL